MTTSEAIVEGRDALERHAWDEAYAVMAAADRDGELGGDGLELLANAAYWNGRPEETIELLERTFAAYLDEGERSRAAMTAFRLAEQHGMRGSLPLAQGWAAKAGELAAGDPTSPVHGWLVWMQGLVSWFEGDFGAAIDRYDEAIALARGTGDRDLEAMSRHDRGHAMCLQGSVAEGLAELDACMATVVGGELGPEAAGYVYCGMIGVCSRLGDYGRAAEWTESTLRWCERESVPAFPGVCRVHRAELLRLHGSLDEAEEQARIACEELPRFNLYGGMGPAHYEIGEVRRRMGDLDGAEEAYERAHGFGHVPQPGLSLLRLSQGRADAAAGAIRQALVETTDNHCARVRLLAAQAEIALAAGDLETAVAADDELAALMEGFQATSLRAMAACVRGAVRLAEGDAGEAIAFLQEARRGWQEIDAPFEAAEARLVLARAIAASGDTETAVMEARAAHDVFERIGARIARDRASQLVEELAAPAAQIERVGRAFLFTDIVRSTDLIGVIGDEAWEDLLSWHDRTLRSLFAAHGGEIGHPTGDGFFVAFPDAPSALRCAVAVQRALADHRRSQGFALRIRIGVHAGRATRRGQDYGGAEVHKAARIAALAEGDEILASAETIGDADGFATSGLREVVLKGFTDPVPVGRVEWR